MATDLIEALGTDERFKDHSLESRWDIVTALRSCDLEREWRYEHGAKLKNLTTARLRGFLHTEYNIIYDGLYYNCRKSPLDLSELAIRDVLLENFTPLHFHLHWTYAVRSIAMIYKYDLQTERRIA